MRDKELVLILRDGLSFLIKRLSMIISSVVELDEVDNMVKFLGASSHTTAGPDTRFPAMIFQYYLSRRLILPLSFLSRKVF